MTLRGPAGRAARSIAMLLFAAVIGVTAARSTRVQDLTAERSLSLTATTQRVLDDLDQLDGRVQITAFLRRDEPGRVEAAALLDRYRRASGRIDWDVRDPDESPGEVARLGIDPIFGGVAVESGDEVERAPAATEQDLTAALARLVRGRDVLLCITTGHGELQLRSAAALLEQEGLRISVVDLLADPELPPGCTAVVVARPTEPLGPAEAVLRRWVAAGGELLVLADPVSEVDLAPVLGPLGLGIRRGLVFEGDADSVVGGDLTAPIVRTYSSGHPIVRRLAPTYFPGVEEVQVDEEAAGSEPGLTVSRLADTTASSYLETEPIAATFDPDADAAGPVTVAAAAERTSNDGTRIDRTRVVVMGDADFASDAFLGQAANAELLRRIVGWLTLEGDLVALSANLPADRPLALTDGRLAYARVLLAVIVPGLFLSVGGLGWAVRRRR